jgi:glyoxylase-like metal-dependent hydrolase (beta-lactamase superfamily II)
MAVCYENSVVVAFYFKVSAWMRKLIQMSAVAEQWFKHERIRDGLFLISEPHYHWFNRANIWLVRGRDADLLIDSGLGVSNLRTYLADLLDKPLKVVASHVHFDHAGGCHEFDEVYIHGHEHEALTTGDQDLMLASPKHDFVRQEEFIELPYEGFAASEYVVTACPHAKALNHGDILDLGDKAFEVLHLPGHSPGSIGLLDARTGQFFSGDVVYDGELLDQLPASVIDEYLASMAKLLDLKVEEVHAGHYRSFDRRYMQKLVRRYLDSKQAPLCPGDLPIR